MLDDLLVIGGVPILPVFLAIIVIVLIVAFVSSRYKVAGANEALIISGRREKGVGGGDVGLKVVRGQGVIVLPLVHKVGRLHLSARQINIALADAVTKQGIKVAVQGVATVKIGGDDESIRNAAERFLDREDQIDSIVKNVLEGSLRSIVGTLTVEELNYDRAKFQQEVQSAARGDLATSGLTIDNFTIQAIRDEVGYMDLIGQQETARRERDARMAKAMADQEAAVREAEAQQIKLNAQRDVSLRQAEVESLTAAASARAAQAGPLAHAEAQQAVISRETELAQLAAERTAKELLATTVRPAEADAEAQVKRAEGDKQARIRQAEADAERVKLAGQAEAAVTFTKGEAAARIVSLTADAEAHRTEVEGQAEAQIVFTKGEAEAKALALRAEAYRQFNDAAIIQTVLSQLPEIVRAAAEPMAHIDNLTVLSSDGATEVVRNATRTLAETSTAVKGLTGIDIPALLSNALGTTETDKAGARGPSGGPGVGSARRATASPRAGAPSPGAVPGAGMTAGGGIDPGAAMARAAAEMDAARTRGVPPAGGPTGRAATPSDERAEGSAAEVPAPSPAPVAPPADAQSPAAAPPARPTAAPPAPLAVEPAITEAALRLANGLRAVPGIERWGEIRLADLDRAGSRGIRDIWHLSREVLESRVGQMTIREFLERWSSPPS